MTARPGTARAPLWLLLSVLLAVYPWSFLVNQWFTANEYYSPLLRASGGLLYPNLQVCLPTVLVWLLVFRAGGLSPKDVGLRRSDLPAGVAATLAIWVICQAVGACVRWETLAPDGLLGAQPKLAAGKLLGQLFGNALYEELIYRGFCLAQFLLILRSRNWTPQRAAWMAAFLSAIVFALPHIPNRIIHVTYAAPADVALDFARLLASGMLLAWIYLRTGNLWWTIGVHSLANYPSLLFTWEPAIEPKLLVTLSGIVGTFLWPIAPSWWKRTGAPTGNRVRRRR